MPDPSRRLRRIEFVRAGWGATMLLAPAFVLRNVHRAPIDTKSIVIARVLGARQLGQALLSASPPNATFLALGAWVDVAHAASAVGLAVANPSRMRAGTAETLVAGTWAVAGYRDFTSRRSGQRLDH